MRDTDMKLMFKAIEQEKITTTMSVPALLQFMLAAPERAQTDMSSIRWIATGDLCTVDEDGFITICDRMKDMIISGGENVYPAELENVLAGCPEVQEAAVIGLKSERWGETPLAIVVPAPGASPTPESLKAFCKKNLAGYKVPQLYELVDALPRNASGKLLKPKLREQFPGPAPF